MLLCRWQLHILRRGCRCLNPGCEIYCGTCLLLIPGCPQLATVNKSLLTHHQGIKQGGGSEGKQPAVCSPAGLLGLAGWGQTDCLVTAAAANHPLCSPPGWNAKTPQMRPHHSLQDGKHTMISHNI
jgi:hypothetical protein